MPLVRVLGTPGSQQIRKGCVCCMWTHVHSGSRSCRSVLRIESSCSCRQHSRRWLSFTNIQESVHQHPDRCCGLATPLGPSAQGSSLGLPSLPHSQPSCPLDQGLGWRVLAHGVSQASAPESREGRTHCWEEGHQKGS